MPAPREGYAWYVFRASYGRAEKAAQHLKDLGAIPYVAYHTVQVTKNGKRRRALKPLLPGILFAFVSASEARLFTRGPEPAPAGTRDGFSSRSPEERTAVFQLNGIISFYYDHFHSDPLTGQNPPLTIPPDAMETFVRATCTHRDVRPLAKGTFLAGDEVLVVEGEFEGLRGRVLRNYRGGPRLCIQLPCLGSFATAHIPAAFFQKCE